MCGSRWVGESGDRSGRKTGNCRAGGIGRIHHRGQGQRKKAWMEWMNRNIRDF